MENRTKERALRWADYWALVVGGILALAFAVCWAQSEYRRGKADEGRLAWCFVALEAKVENERLAEALNNRAAMEEFMAMQTQAYTSIFDAFHTIAPDMPIGNVPSDPELERLCVLYHRETGKTWGGDADMIRAWAKERAKKNAAADDKRKNTADEIPRIEGWPPLNIDVEYTP